MNLFTTYVTETLDDFYEVQNTAKFPCFVKVIDEQKELYFYGIDNFKTIATASRRAPYSGSSNEITGFTYNDDEVGVSILDTDSNKPVWLSSVDANGVGSFVDASGNNPYETEEA